MEFFNKIFRLGQSIPPKNVNEGFSKHFPRARNVEWSSHDDYFEAVFFDEDSEKTATLDNNGKLRECKVNISPENIPAFITVSVTEEFEIMNCIALYTSESSRYELIVRDKELTRYLLLIDSLGYKIRMERL